MTRKFLYTILGACAISTLAPSSLFGGALSNPITYELSTGDLTLQDSKKAQPSNES